MIFQHFSGAFLSSARASPTIFCILTISPLVNFSRFADSTRSYAVKILVLCVPFCLRGSIRCCIPSTQLETDLYMDPLLKQLHGVEDAHIYRCRYRCRYRYVCMFVCVWSLFIYIHTYIYIFEGISLCYIYIPISIYGYMYDTLYEYVYVHMTR